MQFGTRHINHWALAGGCGCHNTEYYDYCYLSFCSISLEPTLISSEQRFCILAYGRRNTIKGVKTQHWCNVTTIKGEKEIFQREKQRQHHQQYHL